MRKVAVTDHTFEPLDIEADILEPLGCRVDEAQCRSVDEVIALVEDADYVITQFSPVDARAIGRMRKAQVIVRYGIGVDNVDIDAAREAGIPVCNVPDFCIDEVADHTIGLILSATRRIPSHALKVHSGDWGLAAHVTFQVAFC